MTLAEAKNLENGDIVYNALGQEFIVNVVAHYEGFKNKISVIGEVYRGTITYKHFIKKYSLAKN